MKELVWADDEEGYKILFCGLVSAECAGLSDEGPGHPIGWFSINIPDPECRPLYSPSHLAKMMKKRGKEKEKIKVTEQPLKAISVRISDFFKHSAAIGSYLYSLGGMEDPSSNNPEEDCVEMWRLDLTDPSSHWSRGPKMTFPRWDPQTIVLDGKLYALGFLLTADCPSECGWMEVYDPELATWEALPNPPSPPPSCYQIRRDDFSCAVIESNKEILLVKHFVAEEEDNLYFATFYSFNIHTRSWITLMPLKRKLQGSFPPSLDRRAVVVGTSLYWAALSEEEHELESSRFYVQAYNLDKDVWLHGSLNARPLFGKHESARSFDLGSPRLLHLRDHFFCLLLHAYFSTSLSYLYCLILNIDDDYKLHKLCISIMSVQKYPMTDVSSLWDNVLLGPG